MNGNNHISGGAFQVARKLFESQIWLEKPATWIKVWLYILGHVNHEDNGRFKRGEGFFHLIRDRHLIGKDITPDIIKKSTREMRVSEIISTRRSTRGMYIKVLNYNKYQTLDNYRSTRLGTRRAPEEHSDKQQLKNDKNIPEQSSGLTTKNKRMKKNSFRYREDLSSDTFESTIDLETGENPQIAKKDNIAEKYWLMIEWSKKKRGTGFVNVPKQFKAFSLARQNKISPERLKDRWIEMEKDAFWKKNGFDWTSVVSSFDKKQ